MREHPPAGTLLKMARSRDEDQTTSEAMDDEDGRVARRGPDREPSSRSGNKITFGRSQSATEFTSRTADSNREGVYRDRESGYQEELARMRLVADNVMEKHKERQAQLIFNRDRTIDKYNEEAATESADVREVARNEMREEKERFAKANVAQHRFHVMQMDGIDREEESSMARVKRACAEGIRVTRTTCDAKLADAVDIEKKALCEISAKTGAADFGRQMAESQMDGPNVKVMMEMDRYSCDNAPSQYIREQLKGTKRMLQHIEMDDAARKWQCHAKGSTQRYLMKPGETDT